MNPDQFAMLSKQERTGELVTAGVPKLASEYRKYYSLPRNTNCYYEPIIWLVKNVTRHYPYPQCLQYNVMKYFLSNSSFEGICLT